MNRTIDRIAGYLTYDSIQEHLRADAKLDKVGILNDNRLLQGATLVSYYTLVENIKWLSVGHKSLIFRENRYSQNIRLFEKRVRANRTLRYILITSRAICLIPVLRMDIEITYPFAANKCQCNLYFRYELAFCCSLCFAFLVVLFLLYWFFNWIKCCYYYYLARRI